MKLTQEQEERFDAEFGCRPHSLIQASEAEGRGKIILYSKQGDLVKAFLAQELQLQKEESEDSKNSAYHERDMLVAALSKLFPAYLARHEDSDVSWEDDWRWIVFIDLPTGQVSWHIHDSERSLFDHLQVKENKWDGHNTDRKYQRLEALKSITPTSDTGGCCQKCGAREVPFDSARTVYACGSSDYDQRPGTFSELCHQSDTSKESD